MAKGATLAGIEVVAIAIGKSRPPRTAEDDAGFLARVEEAIERRKPYRIFAFIGGGNPAVLGLLRHPEPFDVVLPEEPRLPLESRAVVIPYDALRATMLGHVRRHFRRLARLAALGVPVVQAETPPPVPDNEFLARQLARVVPEVDAGRISPPALRYKIWRLHSAVFEEFCRARGISYLRNPPAIADQDGFLRREFWGDAVHGNARYGAALLDRLKEFA
ncbi:MAG: hypothetical protein NZM07_05225 [Elioraea sp.]|nr:hypothetical protein [Elioraea sp.]